VQDTGGEERAPWRMIIYHILGIIVVPPFDRTLLASQPLIGSQGAGAAISCCRLLGRPGRPPARPTTVARAMSGDGGSGSSPAGLQAALELYEHAREELNGLGRRSRAAAAAASSAPSLALAPSPPCVQLSSQSVLAAYRAALDALQACGPPPYCAVVAAAIAKCFVGMSAAHSQAAGPGSAVAEEAYRCSQAAVDADPGYHDGYSSRAMAAMALPPLDGWVQAERDLLRAQELQRLGVPDGLGELPSAAMRRRLQHTLGALRQQRATTLDHWQESGRAQVGRKEYSAALDTYSQALSVCVSAVEEEEKGLLARRSRLLSNRALCRLRLNQSGEALADCDEALIADCSNEKAARWRAEALRGLDSVLEEALTDHMLVAHRRAERGQRLGQQQRQCSTQQQQAVLAGTRAAQSSFDLLTDELLEAVIGSLAPPPAHEDDWRAQLSAVNAQCVTTTENFTPIQEDGLTEKQREPFVNMAKKQRFYAITEAQKAMLAIACVSRRCLHVCTSNVGETQPSAAFCMYWRARLRTQEQRRFYTSGNSVEPWDQSYCATVHTSTSNPRATFLEQQRQFRILDSIAEYFSKRCCDNPTCGKRPRPGAEHGLILSHGQRVLFAAEESERTEGVISVFGAQNRLREGCIHACLRTDAIGKVTPRLLSCGRCGYASYCNRACQKVDWAAHKPNCVEKSRHLPREITQRIFVATATAWAEFLQTRLGVLDEEDLAWFEDHPEQADRGLDPTIQQLLGRPEYTIPEYPGCWPMSLRWFCSQHQTFFGSGDVAPCLSNRDVDEASDFLNEAGVPCMDANRITQATVGLMRLATRRMRGLPDLLDEEYGIVRGVDHELVMDLDDCDVCGFDQCRCFHAGGINETDPLWIPPGSFADAMFPLARSVIEHKLLFLGGRRDGEYDYALFYVDVNVTSTFYGGVYYQGTCTSQGPVVQEWLQTVAHDPTQPPRWKSFADYAQYVYLSQGLRGWHDDNFWEGGSFKVTDAVLRKKLEEYRQQCSHGGSEFTPSLEMIHAQLQADLGLDLRQHRPKIEELATAMFAI
jgi:tetratricopeptide (TPR) repeat protein